MVGRMSTTAPHASEKPDLNELVEQIDYLTSDIGRIDRTLRHIRIATIITAIAAMLPILAFSVWFLLALVNLGLNL